MDKPRPNNKDYLTYGDKEEAHRYAGSPREIAIGLRVAF